MSTNTNRKTDPDYKPTSGQESNENWDENENRSSEQEPKGNSRVIDEQTHTSGAASSQRHKAENLGPLSSDLEQLPSEKRLDRGNLTGSGLG